MGTTEDPDNDFKVLDAVLKRVVTLASVTIFGADGVSVSLARTGELSTLTASSDLIFAMDAYQHELREGPSFSAWTQGEEFHATYLAEESRWPAFTVRAMAQGISSILSYPLAVRGVPVGTLNLCSRRPSAFVGEREQATAFLLACQAAIFLRAHANRDLSTEAPSVEAMSLGLEEPPPPESVSLAQAILEESFRGLGKERVSVDEGRGFEPQSADEIKLREMVGHIPWSVTSSGPPKSRIKAAEPAA